MERKLILLLMTTKPSVKVSKKSLPLSSRSNLNCKTLRSPWDAPRTILDVVVTIYGLYIVHLPQELTGSILMEVVPLTLLKSVVTLKTKAKLVFHHPSERNLHVVGPNPNLVIGTVPSPVVKDSITTRVCHNSTSCACCHRPHVRSSPTCASTLLVGRTRKEPSTWQLSC